LSATTSHIAKVYVVILNYKNWQDVVECLDSLFRSDYPNFSAIVVDNDSRNDSLAHLMEWAEHSAKPAGQSAKPVSYRYIHAGDLKKEAIDPAILPQLTFLQNDQNNGFAGGNNLAIRLLLNTNAYVWLLNPDMTVEKGTMSALVDFAGRHPFKSITGSVVREYLPPHKIHLYGGGKVNFRSGTVTLIREVDDIPGIEYISGGSLFTHTAHFNDIGLLPEDYFLYWEETDWCYQAKGKGYEMRICTTAICYDKGSTTIGKGFLADYYYTRNGLLFLSRYKKNGNRIVFVFVFFRFMKRIVSGKWGKAKGVYNGARSFLKSRNGENQ
jgi:GT2 family glycosyltransferase